MHALAPAPDGGLYVAHVTGRQDLQGRPRRCGNNVLRPGRQVHLVAGGGREGKRLRRHRRKRRDLQDRSRTAKARLSTGPTPPTRPRSPSTRRAICSSAPARPGGCCASIRRPNRSCCSIRRFRRFASCVSTTRARSTSGAQNGRAAGGIAAGIRRPRRRSGRQLRAHASRVGFGLDRDHLHRGRRQPRAARRASRDDPRGVKGAVYRIDAGRHLGSALGIARGFAVQPDVRPDRRPHHRHRQQGQDIPARRRSPSSDAAGARERAAGHRVSQGRGADGCITPRPTPAKCSGSRRTRATRGTYESEPRDAQNGCDVGHDELARHRARRQPYRAVHPIGQHRNA